MVRTVKKIFSTHTDGRQQSDIPRRCGQLSERPVMGCKFGSVVRSRTSTARQGHMLHNDEAKFRPAVQNRRGQYKYNRICGRIR